MKSRFIIVFFFLGVAQSCSTIRYPIKANKYKYELVSVNTALDLALSSYLKGCTDSQRDQNLKVDFYLCKEKALRHVKENIIFILDQKTASHYEEIK